MDDINNLAQSILNIQVEMERLSARLSEQKALLASAMSQENVSVITMPGLGKVTYIKESTRTYLDSKAARELLEINKIEVPLTISQIKATIRVQGNV